jgi:HEAT repeat protein
MTTPRQIANPSLMAVTLACLALAGAVPSALAQTAAKAPVPPAAAAAPASLDAILKQVALYDGGVESAAVWQLRDYVNARRDDAAGRAECEAKLLAFLKSPASPVARTLASRHLRLIAGETAVPALQAMLTDDKSADLALYALQGIPGEASGRALVQALGVTIGATKVEIVAALGERRSAEAVPAIVPLLQQPALAGPAAIALGRIGGDAARSALVASFAGAPAALKPVVASSLLALAEASLAGKDNATALKMYELVLAEASLPDAIRRGAAAGRISASGSGAKSVLLGYLKEPSAATGRRAPMQEAAISKVASLYTAADISEVCALLPGLPDGSKVQLLAALSGYPGDRVAPAVLKELDSRTPAVRMAAFKTLGTVGGPSAVRPLAEAAARAKGPEQAAARVAIGSLKGRAVDEEIVTLLGQKPSDDLAGELLLAVGDRRIFPAKSAVTAALSSPAAATRAQALRALRSIGTPSDMPAVLDLLLGGSEESDRTEGEKTVVALAQKIDNLEGRSNAVRSRLGADKRPDARVRLIGLLALIGDPSALPILRTLAEDDDLEIRDAAVRAVASWPTSAAREDLLRLARESRNQTNRLLAIGGLVRVVGLDRYRDPQAAVADLEEAAALSWRPEEQRLILGAVTRFPCQAALDLANGFLKEPEVKAEAQSAIRAITARLKKESIAK